MKKIITALLLVTAGTMAHADLRQSEIKPKLQIEESKAICMDALNEYLDVARTWNDNMSKQMINPDKDNVLKYLEQTSKSFKEAYLNINNVMIPCQSAENVNVHKWISQINNHQKEVLKLFEDYIKRSDVKSLNEANRLQAEIMTKIDDFSAK